MVRTILELCTVLGMVGPIIFVIFEKQIKSLYEKTFPKKPKTRADIKKEIESEELLDVLGTMAIIVFLAVIGPIGWIILAFWVIRKFDTPEVHPDLKNANLEREIDKRMRQQQY